MKVFIDTSAFYALLDASDANHSRSADIWKNLLEQKFQLFTSNYVIVETIAILQNRFGLDAVRSFVNEILPPVEISWIIPRDHFGALSLILSAGRRRLSLVDAAGFETMLRLGIKNCFAFDPNFERQGFTSVKEN